MGIGLVLVGWTIIFTCFGVPIAIGLTLWSWFWGRRRGHPSVLRALLAGLLPFLVIGVGLTWWMFYALYSEAVRNVDPGIGDTWLIPIDDDYAFIMIDTTDDGAITKSGEGVVIADVIKLTKIEDFIVGVSKKSGAFVLDLTSAQVTYYATPQEALNQFSPPPELQTPTEFYGEHRIGWQDRLALLILFAVELLLIWTWFKLFIRPPSSRFLHTHQYDHATFHH
ncbi:MAG: hypothetical protein GXP42_15460 [Chloroflexi bacterium]|nr:hypothetical protein [Chloroflexota bacterium]